MGEIYRDVEFVRMAHDAVSVICFIMDELDRKSVGGEIALSVLMLVHTPFQIGNIACIELAVVQL